jgi:hypothetical protein
MCSLTTEVLGDCVVNISASGVVMLFMYVPLAGKIPGYFEEDTLLLAIFHHSFMATYRRAKKDLSQRNLEVTVFAM